MDTSYSLRIASPGDLVAVDALLARSYPWLLSADYPPSVIVTALPIIARARPSLLASGRYYLAVDDGGNVLGAGGWSLGAPAADGQQGGERPETGHVRHVATDPRVLRRGVARTIMTAVVRAARGAGMRRMECLSTRTAVPFYASQGFAVAGPEVEIALAPGIGFPAVPMALAL